MNVLHVTPSLSPEWGGPAYSVPSLVAALSHVGVESEIVTTRGHRVGTNPLRLTDVRTHVFNTQFPARVWTAYSKGMSRFLNEEMGRFDLVHASEVWHHAAFVAFRSAKKHGIPFVMSIRGELSQWSLQHKALKKKIYMKAALGRILRGADALHAITSAEKDQLAGLGYDTPVIVAPNGIDTDLFDDLPNPSAFLNRFPTLKGKHVLLFLGRLSPKKGLDILARSFSAISRQFEDTALLVVGPDEYGTREGMESILRSQGLLDRTVFTGLLTGEDKLAAMACADVFVLPSHSDVLGIAVLEALAARIPVVITKGCEFPEVEEHGAGFVVEAEEFAVSEAIATLLSDADLRKQMGERGRKLVTEHYTWEATAATIADLYRSLISKKKSEIAN